MMNTERLGIGVQAVGIADRAYQKALAYAQERIQGKVAGRPDSAPIEFFVPITKGWCTETCIQIASDAVQVHGGMGFIEATGIAQHYRDARIVPI